MCLCCIRVVAKNVWNLSKPLASAPTSAAHWSVFCSALQGRGRPQRLHAQSLLFWVISSEGGQIGHSKFVLSNSVGRGEKNSDTESELALAVHI